MNTSLRLGIVAFSCAGLAGCGVETAILGPLVLPLVAGAVAGAATAIGYHPLDGQFARAERGLCSEATGKGITVTELSGAPILANEGEAQMFEPTFWRPEVRGESVTEINRWSKPAEGMLAATDRSVLFVPSGGLAGIRIPYELVTSVELQQGSFTGASSAIIVRSLCGRIDTFTLAHSQGSINLDPDATLAAATHLKSRVAAFQATTPKATDTPR